jgi:DNA-binding NarL/FixJ family response regulator
VVSVVLVEDEPATRARLAEGVRSSSELRLAAEAGTRAEGLAAVRTHRPEAVLVDLGLPDGSGLDVIRAATAGPEPADVLVISSLGDERSVLAAIEAGAGGYLLKDSLPADVAASVLSLVRGEAPISPAIAVHLIRRLGPRKAGAGQIGAVVRPSAPDRSDDPSTALTERELGVLQLVAKGLSYDEIASVLELRYNTVASYTKGIYRKLAVRSRGEAVFEARQMGLLD